jgi:hypothetical protein
MGQSRLWLPLVVIDENSFAALGDGGNVIYVNRKNRLWSPSRRFQTECRGSHFADPPGDRAAVRRRAITHRLLVNRVSAAGCVS